jgi:hypothetical protein
LASETLSFPKISRSVWELGINSGGVIDEDGNMGGRRLK